ncbi:CDGSH iron-sulfur domain-containing protein [Chloroflexota bacterium]
MKDKPSLKAIKNGPYQIKHLGIFRNSRGVEIETKPIMELCSCGGSNNKPFCDGTHQKIGFSSTKDENRVPNRLDTYVGRNITIRDDRGICSSAGYCSQYSPNVFNDKKEPWIEPDADDPEKTARTIEMCPSGALSYMNDGILHKDQDREPAITIEQNGPYCIVGGIELEDPKGSIPESTEHYALCRCGASKNKPFCSGSHSDIAFRDTIN